MHKLKITNCKNHIEDFTLTDGIHTIGRSLDSTLRLEGHEVSRFHARLLVNNLQCELIDERSTNGTFINGKRITSSCLYNGDIIRVGKFNLQFTSDAAKPHTKWHEEKKNFKIPSLLIGLFLGLSIFAGLFFYQQNISYQTKLMLSGRTAQYLAERNKEALYLGEFDSLNLTNMPKEVLQAAIWDRYGNPRVYYPSGNAPLTEYIKCDKSNCSRNGNKLEIYAPIYYESTCVGTLWLIYRL